MVDCSVLVLNSLYQAVQITGAQRAFRLWTIHTENTFESLPEPIMRMNLALLYLANGDPVRARGIFSSMVPPTAWLGFLTARSFFEIGVLESAEGNAEAARAWFGKARGMWRDGGPAATVWLERVEERIAGPGGL